MELDIYLKQSKRDGHIQRYLVAVKTIKLNSPVSEKFWCSEVEPVPNHGSKHLICKNIYSSIYMLQQNSPDQDAKELIRMNIPRTNDKS